VFRAGELVAAGARGVLDMVYAAEGKECAGCAEHGGGTGAQGQLTDKGFQVCTLQNHLIVFHLESNELCPVCTCLFSIVQLSQGPVTTTNIPAALHSECSQCVTAQCYHAWTLDALTQQAFV
jgi:hypothetical protein